MLKVWGKVVLLAGLAAGCAGNVRPQGPTDVPPVAGADTMVAPPVVPVDTQGATELPQPEAPAPTRSDLAPLPLPQGISADDFDISLGFNGRVAFWLDYYQKYGDTFAKWLGRMSRYEPFIRKQLTSAGLPSDLIYLALIESGFSPNATSHARAVGIWQFMAETARMQGMEVSTYVDERRDPIRATEAAVRHLRGLYRELGSWYLAAAAYNSGEGRVTRALDTLAGGARGADSLFWQIAPALPGETRDYVPQFVAAAILGKYPDRFGLTAASPGPDDFDVIRVDQPTDLAVIARAARTDADVIRRLNAQYYLGVTPPGRTVSVRVPAGTAARVRARLADMSRRERVHNLRYTASSGDTPKAVAQRFGVSLSAFRKANHLTKKTRRLAQGRELIIPLAPPASLARAEPAKAKSRARDDESGAREDRPAPADSSAAPAARAEGRLSTRDVPASSERESRGAAAARAGDPDESGTAGKSARKPSGRTATYVVRPGDTLSGIARAHGLTVARLRALNGLSRRSIIRPGQRLVLQRSRPKVYTVRAGDTLWSIAQDHGVSVERLRAWNELAADAVLRPGDALALEP